MDRDFSNIRKQVSDELETLGFPVSGQYPAGNVVLPRITYSQIANAWLSFTTDRVVMQVDAWANTFEQVMEMVTKIDGVMSSLRGRRTYESPDTDALVNVDLYHKVLSYEFTVDLLLNRFI